MEKRGLLWPFLKKIAGILSSQWVRPLWTLIPGIVVVWIIFRDTPLQKIIDTCREADYRVLGVSLFFGWAANTIRAIRWQKCFEGLGLHARIATLIYAVYGTYAINFAFPRAGEVWRCVATSRTEHLPMHSTFITLLWDRLLDLFCIVVLSVLVLCLNASDVAVWIQEKEWSIDSFYWLKIAVFFVAICAVVALLLLWMMKHRRKRIFNKCTSFCKRMWVDFKMLLHIRGRWQILVYSFAIWVGYFLFFYTTFFAFSFTKNLGITVGITVFLSATVGSMLPTNGGIGTWHWAVITTLCMFDVERPLAEGFAFGVFAIQSLWIILLGIVGLLLLTFVRKKQRAT